MQHKTLSIKAFRWLETRWQFALITLLVVTTFLWWSVLGFSVQNLFRAFFYTLQFVVLNKDLYDPSLPITPLAVLCGLTVAQFLIPLVVSVAFFGSLFREQIGPFLVERTVKALDDHYVVIGHGAIGQALSTSLSKNQKHVVVIDIQAEINSESPYLYHLKCDALSPTLFNAANLGNAKQIYILLPDDRHNLKILESLAKQILKPRSQVDKHPTIFIRAESSHMQKLFADWLWLRNWTQSLVPAQAGKKEATSSGNVESATKDCLDIRPINPYDVAARAIVNEYSPDLYAETDKSGDIAQTIMVVGVSEMAKSLILRFARLGIYSPKGKLRVIWAGRGVSAALADLADDYPSLNSDSHTTEHWGLPLGTSPDFLKLVISPLEIVAIDQPVDHAVRNQQVENVCGEQFPSAVYVCHNSDIENAIEARDVQASLIRRVAALGNHWPGQRLILAFQNQATVGIAQPGNVEPFSLLRYGIKDVCIDALFAKTVVYDCADDLAKKFDVAYSNLTTSKLNAVDQNKWETSRFFLKEMNRDPADHAAIKARFAGVEAEVVRKCYFKGQQPAEDHSELLNKCKEDLGIMEMRRYRAFMFLHGYSHGVASANKDTDRAVRINETLLDQNLSPIQKKKDESIVGVTLRALAMDV